MSPSLSPGGALQPLGPALVWLWQLYWHLHWLVPSLFLWEESQESTLMIPVCPTGVRHGSARTGIPPPLSSIYTWGSGITTPLRLPMLNTEVVQVSAGRTQKAGVTKSGRLVLWEVSDREPGAGSGCGGLGCVISVKEEFLLTHRPWHCLLQDCRVTLISLWEGVHQCSPTQLFHGFSPSGSSHGCCRGPFSPRSHRAAPASVCVPLSGGPVWSDHQTRVLR